MNLLDLFRCRHSNYSFPQSKRGKGCHVVCLDCGKVLEYDWQEMRVVKHSHSGFSGAALGKEGAGVNMKALTLWQPWASLVAFEEKKVETRCWSTKYRGLLAIHAAQKEPPDWLGKSRNRQEFHKYLCGITKRHQWGDFWWPNGKRGLAEVLCIVKLISIEPVERVREDLSAQELCFGNYEDGRYAWFLEMVHRFESPIPAKGNRLLWNWEVPAEYEHLCAIPDSTPEQTSIPLEVEG
jgi:activating signal cointegrator 1